MAHNLKVIFILNLFSHDVNFFLPKAEPFYTNGLILNGLICDKGLIMTLNDYYFFISCQNTTANGCLNGNIDVVSGDHSAVDPCLPQKGDSWG